jgi:hypothetical protein
LLRYRPWRGSTQVRRQGVGQQLRQDLAYLESWRASRVPLGREGDASRRDPTPCSVSRRRGRIAARPPLALRAGPGARPSSHRKRQRDGTRRRRRSARMSTVEWIQLKPVESRRRSPLLRDRPHDKIRGIRSPTVVAADELRRVAVVGNRQRSSATGARCSTNTTASERFAVKQSIR